MRCLELKEGSKEVNLSAIKIWRNSNAKKFCRSVQNRILPVWYPGHKFLVGVSLLKIFAVFTIEKMKK